jgi:hypothetical protein
MTDLKWCRRTTGKIADLLGECGFAISANTIARLLHGMKFSLRVNQKKLTTSASSDRNLQFVSAYLDRRHYPTGIAPAPEQLHRLRLEPHDTLPKWNYTIKPNSY